MSDTRQMRYDDLLDEALARIPALAPEWTDHNPSDPGIALLELAAWLTETVLYRSTRVDDRSRRALLGLIEGADPGTSLTGAELDMATRAAIKALRRPYRAVTPRDFVDRIRDDWPTSSEAKALGLERRVAHVTAMPRCDLEADDRFARRDAHMSLVVVPDRLMWSFSGALSTARPTLFITQDVAEAVQMKLPAGGRVTITGESATAVVYEGDFEARETGELLLDPGDMGVTGEYRITLDQANCVAGLKAEGGAVEKRQLTKTDGTLLGCRFVPIKRNGDLEIVVTCAADIPLLLEVRTERGQVKAREQGVGVVAISVRGGKNVVTDQDRVDWQCRLFAPEADPGAEVAVTWHVQRAEVPRRWDDSGGDRLLDGLWRFLDARRIIGTRHHVVGPRWVPFSITADIYLTDDTDPELVRPRLINALVGHFAPPGHGQKARPLGEDLHYTEVIAAIEAVPGVDYVDRVALTPEDRWLVDDGEHYGIRLERDEIAVLQVAASDLSLFERS